MKLRKVFKEDLDKKTIINATVEVDDGNEKETEKKREDNLKEFSDMLKGQEELEKDNKRDAHQEIVKDRKALSVLLHDLKESNIPFRVRRNLDESVEGRYIVFYNKPLNENKEVKEAISQSITIYEKDKDGVPEIGREFIAYASGHKKHGIFKRVDKSKFEKESDAKGHISSDGEFYAEVEHGWIYGIDFDSYAYVDELGLKSSNVAQKETDEKEAKIAEALDAFKKVFGDKYAEGMLTAFSRVKDNRFEIILPFSVYKGNLDINHYSVCDHDDCSVFIKMMINKGFTEAEAKDLLRLVVDYNWSNEYTNEKMKEIKETSNLNKILDNNANESYDKELKEDEERHCLAQKRVEKFGEPFDGARVMSVEDFKKLVKDYAEVE